MKTLKKRVLSGAMAGVLAMSLAVPAFASTPNKTTNVDVSYKDTPVQVVVQPSAVAFINPYGLDVKVPEDGHTTTGTPNTTTISGQQIVSAPMALKNQSAMDLNVKATVTAAIPAAAEGEVAMKLAASTTKGVGSDPEAEGYIPKATGKSAFVYLEAKQEPTLTGADGTVDAAAIATKFAAWAPSTFDATKHPVLNATKAVEKEELVVLRSAAMDNTGAFSTYKAGSVALVRLAGDCVAAPKDAWKTSDTFTATIVYDFTPANITKYAITLAPTNAASGDSLTADYTSAAPGDVVTITATTTGNVTAPVIKKADGSAFTPTITATAVDGATNKWTFTMPSEEVKVTAAFSA